MVSIYFPFALAFFTMITVRGGQLLLALYALQLDAQPVTVGLLAATFSVLPVLMGYQVGKLSDRFGSRWPLVFGITGGALGIMVPYFFHNLAALFIAAAMNGFAFAFYNVSLQHAIGALSTPQTSVRNFSNFTLMVSVANFIAPMFAGFAIDHSGHAVTCLYIALFAIVPVAMLVLHGSGLPKGTGRIAKSGSNMLNTLSDPTVRRVLVIGCLMQTGVDLYLFYMPVYAHGIGLSASTIGVILSAFAVASFVVRLLLARLLARFSVERVLLYAFAVGAAGFFLVPLFENPVLLCIVSFLFGMGVNVGQPISLTLSFSNAASGRAGEAMGVRQTFNHLTKVIGPIVFGSIGSAFGLFPVFWINAAMLASGCALVRSGKLSNKEG